MQERLSLAPVTSRKCGTWLFCQTVLPNRKGGVGGMLARHLAIFIHWQWLPRGQPGFLPAFMSPSICEPLARAAVDEPVPFCIPSGSCSVTEPFSLLKWKPYKEFHRPQTIKPKACIIIGLLKIRPIMFRDTQKSKVLHRSATIRDNRLELSNT